MKKRLALFLFVLLVLGLYAAPGFAQGASVKGTCTDVDGKPIADGIVIFANQDYGCEWDYDWRNKRFRARDNTKFSVNLVVYAMT